MRISIFQRREALNIDTRSLVWNKARQANDSTDGLPESAGVDEEPLSESEEDIPIEEPQPTALPPSAATEAPDSTIPATEELSTAEEISQAAETSPPAVEPALPVETTVEAVPTSTVEAASPSEPLIDSLPAATEEAAPTDVPAETAAQTTASEIATPSPSVPDVINPVTTSAETAPSPDPVAALPATASETSSDLAPAETPSIDTPTSTAPADPDQTSAPAADTIASSVNQAASSISTSISSDAATPSALSPTPSLASGALPAVGIASSTNSATISGAAAQASSGALANAASPNASNIASSIANAISGSSTFLTVTSNIKPTSTGTEFQRLSAVQSSFTQAADTLPTAGVANLDSGTGTNAGTLSGGTDVDGNPTGANGITQTSPDKVQASKTTIIISAVAIGLGSIALFVGIVFLIRRIMRKRRIGKAESPPSSPLLTPMDSPMPLSIARSMSQRTGGEDFWNFSNGNTIAGPRNEKPLDFGGNDGYRGVAPLSPLPPAAKGTGNNPNEFAGFKLFPNTSK